MRESNPICGQPIYAHSLPEPFTENEWETLEDHAQQVATLARQFAGAFNAAEWGHLAGMWHNLEKIQAGFQTYIRGVNSSDPPHAWIGALLAATVSKKMLPLAFAIARHHCGLADCRRDSTVDAADGPEHV